jgi:hypothetical protein
VFLTIEVDRLIDLVRTRLGAEEAGAYIAAGGRLGVSGVLERARSAPPRD